MEEKIYVIRYLSFWYTDEWYESLLNIGHHFGHISAIFEDKALAIQEWKRLEYEFSHQSKFYSLMYCELCHFIDQEEILAKMSIDELFKAITQANCHVYGLYEYPKNIKQQVEWNSQTNHYNTINITQDYYDTRTNIVVEAYFFRDDPLLKEISPPVDIDKDLIPLGSSIILTGCLSDLSVTPILLSQLIQQDEHLDYNENSKTLTIQPYTHTINSLNPLLKNPIRFLSIEQIYQLEKPLNKPLTQEN